MHETKRKTQGLTQEELGRKIGVTNKAVSKWEVGETCPDISMLAPLSKALGVTIDELLNYTDKEKVETTKKKNSFLMLLIIIA
ncbi:MAG: helix-turn-helix transcriptional regulator, partial [Paraprevotella sp.]|nr:helix-turn-helix transcriptional regulator [Paraprevotella sp.]